MPVNVNDVYKEVNLLARKHATGATFTPDQFNTAAPAALRDFVRKYIGLPEQYAQDSPVGPIGYETTSIIKEYLGQFKKTDFLLSVNSAGIATKPSDFFYVSAIKLKRFKNITVPQMYASIDLCSCGCGSLAGGCPKDETTYETKYVEVPVEIVDDMQYQNRLNSQNRAPSLDYPICKIEKGRFQFAPFNVGSAYITYLYDVNVGAPYWGYTATIPPVYDPLTSVNFNLPSICQTELVIMILQRLGISIREETLLAYAQGVKTTGV